MAADTPVGRAAFGFPGIPVGEPIGISSDAPLLRAHEIQWTRVGTMDRCEIRMRCVEVLAALMGKDALRSQVLFHGAVRDLEDFILSAENDKVAA